MLPSLTPTATRTSRTRLNASAASAADRRSGSVTISMSGTPLRLKSRWVERAESGEAVMQRLAGVLFHVDARDADAHRAAVGGEARSTRRSRAAGRTARSGSPSAGRDRSSSCARRSTRDGRGSRAPARRAPRARRRGGSAPAARPAARGRPDTARYWARRRTAWSSRRRSWWRSAAARGSRGR